MHLPLFVCESEDILIYGKYILQRTGVDFDRRCNKYRVRLTRKGIVYLIDYFPTLHKATAAREDALKKYNAGEKFEFLHSYEASSKKKEYDDDFLYSLVGEGANNPQRSLLVAVLSQAIRDILSKNDEEARDEAKQWFESTQRGCLRFSFLDICEELDIKPQTILTFISNTKPRKRTIVRRTGRRSIDKTRKSR